MKWILSLFLCLSASAQLPVIPYYSSPTTPLTPCQLSLGSGFPTNIAGYPAYGWWVAGCYFTNGSSVAVLTDYSLNNLDLTNTAVGNAPSGQPAIFNGFAGVGFYGGSGTHELHNTFGSWIPSGNLAEFWCVMSCTNVANSTGWLFHDVSANNTGLQIEHNRFGTKKMAMIIDTTSADSILTPTNKYVLYNFVFTQGANTVIYTNNVSGVTINIGSGSMASFLLGGGLNANNPLNFSFLEGGWYRTNLTSAGRLALFQYVTNKYTLIIP